jgi:hypothetical protein
MGKELKNVHRDRHYCRVRETIAKSGNLSNEGNGGKQATIETIGTSITMVTMTMIAAFFCSRS